VSAAARAVRVRSTRAPEGHGSTSLDEAILAGLAPDGGLFVPIDPPPLPPDWTEATSLADLAVRVLAPWWGPEADEVAPALRDALPFDAPLRPLSQGRWSLELFHGPTLSFKDVGARVMARLAGRALARRGRRATVLVATSGDTGSAVADGFAGVPGVRVALLYPKDGVSDVQERQLIAARPGVRAFAVEGDFDACQRLVKQAFADEELRASGLTSANSINVGRLLPQMLYYLWGALQLRRSGETRPPYVVVPSGNLGNVTAGLLAASAGLPVHGFVAAHNANRFLPDVLAGRRAPDAFPATVRTLSNAMDVGAPSNFERLHALYGDRLGEVLDAVSIDDDATLRRMRTTHADEELAVCPHTAVGLEGLARLRAARPELRDVPAVVLATAHPAKFPAAVERATGAPPPAAAALEAVRRAETRVEPLRADLATLAQRLRDGGWPD
jgi:threonine synthase